MGLAVSDSILSGHGVSRVHGGGFAGTIQAFVSDDFVETYRETLDGVYGAYQKDLCILRRFLPKHRLHRHNPEALLIPALNMELSANFLIL